MTAFHRLSPFGGPDALPPVSRYPLSISGPAWQASGGGIGLGYYAVFISIFKGVKAVYFLLLSKRFPHYHSRIRKINRNRFALPPEHHHPFPVRSAEKKCSARLDGLTGWCAGPELHRPVPVPRMTGRSSATYAAFAGSEPIRPGAFSLPP